MKKICIIYTGGTIGMVPTKMGYAPRKDYLLTVLNGIPDLKDDAMPEWDLIEFPELLDSSNVAVDQWVQIGKSIYDSYNNYDGFVVLHGTDTMAFTASVLSFILEGLAKPVILTGSQIPLCQLRSDGRDNLISSLLIAAQGQVKEVAVCFGGKLLRGNRCTKISADRLFAFESPSYPHLAEIGINIVYNDSALYKPTGEEALSLVSLVISPIGVLKIFPGIQFDLFKPMVTKSLDGVVLEGFGSGNIPDNDHKLLPIIKEASDNGAILVVCSQCLQGTVSLGTYATSMALKQAGAVSGYDMTTEAGITKLYYLFSKGYSKERIKELMETNLRGELTK